MTKAEQTVEMYQKELTALHQIKQAVAKRELVLKNLIQMLQSEEMRSSVDLETIVSDLNSVLKGEFDHRDTKTPVTNSTNFDWYPLSSHKEERFKAILRHSGKVLRAPDFEEMVAKIEGPDRVKETLKSGSWFTLKQLLTKGEMLSCKVNNSKKHYFFAFPEWIEGKKGLNQEYYPDPVAWGNLPESERTFKNQVWEGGSES